MIRIGFGAFLQCSSSEGLGILSAIFAASTLGIQLSLSCPLQEALWSRLAYCILVQTTWRFMSGINGVISRVTISITHITLNPQAQFFRLITPLDLPSRGAPVLQSTLGLYRLL